MSVIVFCVPPSSTSPAIGVLTSTSPVKPVMRKPLIVLLPPLTISPYISCATPRRIVTREVSE